MLVGIKLLQFFSKISYILKKQKIKIEVYNVLKMEVVMGQQDNRLATLNVDIVE